MLALAQVQHRHNGSLFVLRGVTLKDLIDEFEVLLGELEGESRVVGGFVAVLDMSAGGPRHKSTTASQRLMSRYTP